MFYKQPPTTTSMPGDDDPTGQARALWNRAFGLLGLPDLPDAVNDGPRLLLAVSLLLDKLEMDEAARQQQQQQHDASAQHAAAGGSLPEGLLMANWSWPVAPGTATFINPGNAVEVISGAAEILATKGAALSSAPGPAAAPTSPAGPAQLSATQIAALADSITSFENRRNRKRQAKVGVR